MNSSKQDQPRPRRLPGHRPTADECGVEQHNWSAFELQLHHAACPHSAHRADLLLELRRKLNHTVDSKYSITWMSLKKWQAYDVTGSIVACSDYDRRIDFIHCGYSEGSRHYTCKDRFLCPRCCHNRHAIPLLEEFGDASLSGVCAFYIVSSWCRDADETKRLIFRDADGSDLIGFNRRTLTIPCSPADYGVEFKTHADVEQVRLLLEIVSECFRKFMSRGKGRGILGAVGGPELALQLVPLRVLPHANYVISATSFTIEDARKLRRLIRKKMRDCRRLKLGLFPSIACYRLASRDDLKSVLKYSMKPVDVATAYTAAAERVNYAADAMAGVNREVNTFLRHLPDVFYGVRRIERYGGCYFGSKDYIGHVTPRRAARREREAERRRELHRNGLCARRSLKNSASATPKKRGNSNPSRFSFWLAAVTPAPPPAPPTYSHVAPSSIFPPTSDGEQQQNKQ